MDKQPEPPLPTRHAERIGMRAQEGGSWEEAVKIHKQFSASFRLIHDVSHDIYLVY